ncbi:MAG: hypothetical protein NVS4B13_08270 [Candidatus Elarobacter sp.]
MSTLSRVVVDRLVRCPFSVAHEYAEDFFRDYAEGGAEVRVPLRDFVSLGGRLRRPVRVVFDRSPDQLEAGRGHDALEVHWTAGTRLFPEFHGSVRLRIASVEETRLTLEGAYRPPFGPAGAVFDTLAGRRIARATMRDLLDRLCDAMERRESAFRGVRPV